MQKIKNALFCAALLVFYPSQAQTTFNQEVDFAAFGFPFHVFTSVLPTDSCYYVTGNISTTVDSFLAFGNIFARFGLDGELQFYKTLTDPDRDYYTWRGDLVATGDGGLLDIGIVVDTIIKGVLIKYDTNGDTLFTREYFSPMYPEEDFLYAAGLKVTGDNRIKALFGFDAGPANDIYLLTLDSAGNILGSDIYADPAQQIPQRLVLDGDGGVLIPSNKTNTHLVNMNFASRTHILRVDSAGTVAWEYHTPHGQLFDHAHELVKAPDGGVVISSGKGIEHQINIESAQLRWNSYIFKLGENQQVEWATELKGSRPSSYTGLYRLVSAADGSGYVGVGRVAETVSTGDELFSTWLVKVSPEGDSLWARYFNFFGNYNAQPNPYDLKTTPDGGYIICGETDPSNIGDIKDGSWLMKVDEHGCLIPGCHLVSTDDPPNHPIKLAIYPNPATHFLNFQLRGERPKLNGGQFRIIDTSGRIMREVRTIYPNDTHILSISGWPSGAYSLQYLLDGQVITTEKFIKN